MDVVEKVGILTKIKNIIHEGRTTFKQAGLKGVIKKYGWKFFAVFFIYYLVRDVTLYIIIPLYIAKSVIN